MLIFSYFSLIVIKKLSSFVYIGIVYKIVIVTWSEYYLESNFVIVMHYTISNKILSSMIAILSATHFYDSDTINSEPIEYLVFYDRDTSIKLSFW